MLELDSDQEFAEPVALSSTDWTTRLLWGCPTRRSPERCGLDLDLGHPPRIPSVGAPRFAVAAGCDESGDERQMSLLVVGVALEDPQ